MGKKATRRKQSIPKDESKADRFVRVVTPRVAKAIKAIRHVSYCAGSTYEYTSNQTRQIAAALAAELVALESSFEEKAETQKGFTFTK